MNPGDTIAAISTPLGVGGIGVVRLSGPQAREILGKVFRRRRGKGPLLSHRFYLGEIIRPRDTAVIDEVLASFMEKPRTYTREDVAEIQAHSGVLVLREILDAVLQSGARLAEPGEFTKRAFLNGRIDLTQAEAVIDLIQSKTRRSLEMANLQREGRLGMEIRRIREDLLNLMALLEAGIDFPEEEVPEFSGDEVNRRLQDALERLDTLLRTYDAGENLPRGDFGGHHRPAQRGKIKPAERPSPGRPGHRDPHPGHHPGRHRRGGKRPGDSAEDHGYGRSSPYAGCRWR